MRALSTSAAAAIASPRVSLAILVEMDLTSPLYLNSSRMTLTIGGTDYLGVGPLGSIDPIRETNAELPKLSFNLSGVPQDMVSLMLSEAVQGKAVRIKTAFFDSTSGAVLDTALRYAGLLDVMGMADGKESATVSVQSESVTLTLLRPSGIYYSNDDQQALSVGDLAFQYVNDQVDQRIIWPAWSFWAK
jgi:hypothetical protein